MVCVIVLGALMVASALADMDYVKKQESLSNKLLAGYSKNIKPDHKVNVTVNIFIRHIKNIHLKEGSMEFQLTFRQRWQDSRLVYADQLDYLTLIPGAEKSIWVPDTFFRNEVESTVHNVMVPNEYIRVFPNGEVLYSARLTLKTTCSLDLAGYPFDSQTCGFQIASYGYTRDDIEYFWKQANPLQISSEVHPEYSLDDMTTSTRDVITTTGAYSCISADFTFQRAAGHAVLTVLVPTSMAVAVSWGTFFIQPTQLTARVLVGMLTLMLTSIFSFVVNTQLLPVINYTKSIDVFLGVSIFLIFLSLVETLVVSLYYKNEDDKRSGGYLSRLRTGSCSTRLDLASRVIFPATFLLFTAIYAIAC